MDFVFRRSYRGPVRAVILLLGLREDEVNALGESQRDAARREAESHLYRAGAHSVVDGIWGLPAVLDEIGYRTRNC